jgi:preprotein translocase subunit SecF
VIEIVSPGTHIDFIGRWKIAALISVLVIAAGLAAAPAQLQMGIDFAGGWEIQARFDESISTDEAAIRGALSSTIEDVSVVRFGSDHEFLIRFAVQPGEDTDAPAPRAGAPGSAAVAEEAPGAAASDPDTDAKAGEPSAPERETPPAAAEAIDTVPVEGDAVEDAAGPEMAAELGREGAPQQEVEAALADAEYGFAQGQRADRIRVILGDEVGAVSLERIEFVGPRVGAELRRAGASSLLIAGLMILIYISFRFTFRFAPGAIVALLHDVLVTASLWVLMGREFNLQVLAALLAIVGYSLNDTIIVYDRIRENMALRTTTNLPEVLNRSINQTLSRTFLTSLTTLLAVLSLLFLGGEVIRPFASAMAIGIVIGTYSSIFVAAPVLLWLESRHGAAATT